jgi:hypothetical protein
VHGAQHEQQCACVCKLSYVPAIAQQSHTMHTMVRLLAALQSVYHHSNSFLRVLKPAQAAGMIPRLPRCHTLNTIHHFTAVTAADARASYHRQLENAHPSCSSQLPGSMHRAARRHNATVPHACDHIHCLHSLRTLHSHAARTSMQHDQPPASYSLVATNLILKLYTCTMSYSVGKGS